MAKKINFATITFNEEELRVIVKNLKYESECMLIDIQRAKESKQPIYEIDLLRKKKAKCRLLIRKLQKSLNKLENIQ